VVTHLSYQILLGLLRFYLYRDKLETAYELGEQLWLWPSTWERYIARAHGMHGETLYRMGELKSPGTLCTVHTGQFQPSEAFGNDALVLCQVVLGLTWQLISRPGSAGEPGGLSHAASPFYPGLWVVFHGCVTDPPGAGRSR
jgi:hypothetical protein